MIDRDHELPIKRQAELVGISSMETVSVSEELLTRVPSGR
jgi:hypothetical protein